MAKPKTWSHWGAATRNNYSNGSTNINFINQRIKRMHQVLEWSGLASCQKSVCASPGSNTCLPVFYLNRQNTYKTYKTLLQYICLCKINLLQTKTIHLMYLHTAIFLALLLCKLSSGTNPVSRDYVLMLTKMDLLNRGRARLSNFLRDTQNEV